MANRVPRVDWADIDAALREVPEEYRGERFYPLKHVVEIFSSEDPELLTLELRERQDRLSELVDDVVEAYHNGFAKSIQNYSLILQLFQESKQQVDTLKRAISDGTKQLSAQSKTLHSQWKRNLTMQSSLALLDEIKQVVEIPAKVEAAVAAKDWSSAVNELLDGCQMMVGDDLARVGALRKLRGDMSKLSRWIQDLLYEELQQRVYHQQAAAPVPDPAPQAFHAARPSAATMFRAAGAAAVALASAGGALAAVAPNANRLPLAKAVSTKAASYGSFLQLPQRAGASTIALGRKGGSILQAAPSPKGLATLYTRATTLGHDTGPRQAPTKELVRCLAQLDGVAEGKAYLRYHTRVEIRRLMHRSLETAAETAQATYHSIMASGRGDAGGGLSLAVPHAVEVLAQRLVQEVCDASLKALTNMGSVLEELADAPSGSGHAQTLALLRQQEDHPMGTGSAAPSLTPSSSFATLSTIGGKSRRERDGRLPSQERAEYVKAEYLHAWAQMQEEWLLMLSELLLVPVRTMGTLAEAGQQQTQGPGTAGPAGFRAVEGWLMGMADLAEQALGGKAEAQLKQEQAQQAASAKPQQPESKLTFTFEVTIQGLTTEQAGAAVDAKTHESSGYSSIIVKALGNNSGSPYLTPAVYTAIKSFAEAAIAIVSPALRLPTLSEDLPAPPGGRRGGTGGGAAAASSAALEQQSLRWLLQQLEAYVQDSFLPQMWVDLRGRCTAALEHPDAFRAAQGLAATGTGAAARGLGAAFPAGAGGAAGGTASSTSFEGSVPAARFVERMLRDIGGWSNVMLGFEMQFSGLLENLLSRALDAFAAAAERVAGSSRVFHLVARPDVAHVMALEPDAPMLLGGPVAFLTPAALAGSAGTGVWDLDSFVASLKTHERPELVHMHARPETTSTGFGGGGPSAEAEILMLLFKQQPVPADQLLCGFGPSSSSARLLALAALGESTDHVGDAIARQIGRRQQGLQNTLGYLVQRCRMLSGACARALRLELQLQVVLLMHPLGRTSHLCDGDDAKEVHSSVGTLLRVLARLGEELEPHLRPMRAAYVLGGVAPAAARTAIWLLPDIQELNRLGVQRMLRTLSILQPALSGLTPRLAAAAAAASSSTNLHLDDLDIDDLEDPHGGGDSVHVLTTAPKTPDELLAAWALRVARLFAHGREYYGMLLLPVDDMLSAAEARPLRYTYAEWAALLEAQVQRRLVTVGHMERLQQGLDAVYGIVPQNKLAEALGTVVGALQAPAEMITDTLTDVLRVGGGALVAGAMLPAQGIMRVIGKIQEQRKQQPKPG